jgi:predicted Rossmann fold flavoprotein
VNTVKYDVIVVGAGAAGLMAALTAGKRGRKVLLIEHTNKIAEKIRISGGGRCNFTNLYTSPKNYLSQNPHFMISALARYTQYDFIKLIESYNISYHEKTLGQLFCDGSATQIINMLLAECKMYNVTLLLNNSVELITKNDEFYLETSQGIFQAQSLIIASGGLSIPKLGASNFGYKVAKQFDLQIVPTRPALVPLTIAESNLKFFKDLSGISIPSIVSNKKTQFRENILFTHRGLSGPAILQISSYLEQVKQAEITINLLPEVDIKELFISDKNNKILLSSFLKEYLPKKFVEKLSITYAFDKRMIDYKLVALEKVAHSLHNFIVKIEGTEGYMKAEVTAGGIDTNELSSKTMEAKKVPGLFFIGEVVDVTGWLGGYNFQWAWSSGYVAGINA